MTQLLGKIAADFNTVLQTKMAVSATTGTLTSATDDDGVALPTGRYFLTIDRNNSSKEYISCTLTGTALTGIKTMTRQGVETSGTLREHRKGAEVVITDFAHIKKINDLLDGTANLDAGTPLKYDGVASISDAKHLATKAYVDLVAGGIAITDSVIIAGNAGETIAAGQPIYFDNIPKTWKLAGALIAACQNPKTLLAIAQGVGTSGNPITGGVLLFGNDSNQSSLTGGSIYYLSSTPGTITQIKPSDAPTIITGIAIDNSGTTLCFTPSIPLFDIDTATPLNNVKRIRHGFVNFLSNSSFEHWLAGTSVAPSHWTAGGGITIARSTTSWSAGSYVAQLTFDTSNTGEIYQALPVSTNVDYTFSLYVERTSGSGNARLVAQRADAPFTEFASVALPTAAGQNLVTLAIKPSAGTQLRFAIKSSDATASVWKIDEAVFEESKGTATAWKEAYLGDTSNGFTVFGVPTFASGFNYAVDSGSANAYAVTLAGNPTGYQDGAVYFFRTANANTGASTVNFNSIGTKSIVKNFDVPLIANDIKAGIVQLVYNSSADKFQMLGQTGNLSSGLLFSSATQGNVTLTTSYQNVYTTQSIPANTLGTGNVITVPFDFNVDLSGAITCLIQISYGGTVFFTITLAAGGAVTPECRGVFYLYANAATNAQYATCVIQTDGSASKYIYFGNGTAAVDSTAAQNLIIQAKEAGGSTTFRPHSYSGRV